jgi:hypothetical protein
LIAATGEGSRLMLHFVMRNEPGRNLRPSSQHFVCDLKPTSYAQPPDLECLEPQPSFVGPAVILSLR